MKKYRTPKSFAIDCEGTKCIDDDIVEYVVKDTFKKVGEGENDFVVIPVVVESARFNRKDYINSFRDDVGILNILKKVQLSGDVTLLNQRPSQGENLVDISNYPDNFADAMNILDKAQETSKKAGVTVDNAGAMSQADFEAYVAKLVADKVAATQAAQKEGN